MVPTKNMLWDILDNHKGADYIYAGGLRLSAATHILRLLNEEGKREL